MAKSARVVIGANYGDEGKGLMTDYFAAQDAHSLVVRFNGGCQAGHTVTTPEGARHVFSHVGSGAFTGAATYLSKHFAVNPVLYFKERPQLEAGVGELPKLYVDARAPVTTYFDMLLNQLVEEARGIARHGSCGMGFGETIGRHEESPYQLTVGELADTAALRRKLRAIRDEYLPGRCKALGLPAEQLTTTGKWEELLTTDALVNAFVQQSQLFLEDAELVDGPRGLLARSNNVVMEGAQGLQLDQVRGAFPHVTRSHTGLRNALEIAEEAGLSALDVTYVTRAYLTRHGAGPLAHELPGKPYAGIDDRTNIPNEYQGALRFAYLDLDLLSDAVRADSVDTRGFPVVVTASLAVSCLDQLGAEPAKFWQGGELLEGSRDFLLESLSQDVLPVGYQSYGPTRADVRALAAAAPRPSTSSVQRAEMPAPA